MVEPAADSVKEPESSEAQPIKIFGIPLPHWAVVAVSAIVVCYTAGSYGVRLYGDWLKTHVAESSYSNAITTEIKAHEHDTGQQTVLFTDKDGPTVATYFSDGCIALSRPGPKLPYLSQGESQVEWSLAPVRRPQAKPPDSPGSIWHSSALPRDSYSGEERAGIEGEFLQDELEGWRLTGPQSQKAALGAEDDLGAKPVQGTCVNPHAGPFNSWWAPANGCWAPFWRQWRDGCTHYQMYNTCTGYWDPQIHWTFCAVQHFY